jgi:hypothetical protein
LNSPNLAQVARTFQDRSHLFQIQKRPDTISNDENIYNVQVRGRRGNIVQTFPAVEYDFVPTHLDISSKDLVHFQWEGSNSQPDTEGQGRAQTDRSNIVSMGAPAANIPQGMRTEITTFTVQYSDGGKTFEYLKFTNVDVAEARTLCNQIGMKLPEPSDAQLGSPHLETQITYISFKF